MSMAELESDLDKIAAALAVAMMTALNDPLVLPIPAVRMIAENMQAAGVSWDDSKAPQVDLAQLPQFIRGEMAQEPELSDESGILPADTAREATAPEVPDEIPAHLMGTVQG